MHSYMLIPQHCLLIPMDYYLPHLVSLMLLKLDLEQPQSMVLTMKMSGIEPLVANVQGFIGVVTGISTVPGIGTDLALQIQFDVQEYVNNGNDPTGLQTGQPFRLYGSGINTAGVALTSIDTHDTDIVAISTYNGDNIYYTHGISFVPGTGSRLGIITTNIASYRCKCLLASVTAGLIATSHGVSLAVSLRRFKPVYNLKGLNDTIEQLSIVKSTEINTKQTLRPL